MTKLSEVKAGESGRILMVGGKPEFQRRITAVGITPGGNFSVLQNEKKYPMLLNIRSTMLAVNRSDCNEIMVEVNTNE